ncbi:glucose-6-phosphate isomerase [Rhodovibrio sodomensis]|nr:glucose-6-phosphate isomerase [Rhodovibrio sodomensis]
MTLPYTHDIDGCLAAGSGRDAGDRTGLPRARFEPWSARAGEALARLRTARDDGRAPAFVQLPGRTDDLAAVERLARHFTTGFDTLLVLGTGGSSLGGQAVAALVQRGFGPPPGAPEVRFLDNVDPDTFHAMTGRLSPAKTGVLAISKSGGTAETLCQLAIVMAWLGAANGDSHLSQHVAVMTETLESPLGQLAGEHGLAVLDHDPELGGRFSVLSTAALPAMLLGLDVRQLRAGAAAVNAAALDAIEPAETAPALGAAVQVALAREAGVSQSVLMPYCDRLFWFARWYRQLWAESLGKQGNGTTPIDAIGTVDQHSQLQLYLDGPADKLFTLVNVPAGDVGPAVDPYLVPGADYLADATMGQLFDAEARATRDSLRAHGRPVRTIDLQELDAYRLGALFQHFMLETAIAADLLGVDAYDQPAVEDGKQRTKALMRDRNG